MDAELNEYAAKKLEEDFEEADFEEAIVVAKKANRLGFHSLSESMFERLEDTAYDMIGPYQQMIKEARK